MEWLLQLLLLSVTGVIAASVLEERNAEICAVFILALLALCVKCLYVPIESCVKLAAMLLERTQLPGEAFYLLLKSTFIAMLVRFTASFCKDVSRSALAVLVEYGGVIGILLLNAPLLERLIALLEGWL